MFDNIKKEVENGYFKGENNLDIYYEKLKNENSNKVIVIVHGFCETIEKYKELKEVFYKNNYSLYLIEHRGHGRSGRLGKDNSQISVEDFNHYIQDLKNFMDTVVIPETYGKKLFLFGHSMGGAISALFLQKYSDYFQAAVLSAPMMEIDTGKYLPWFSKLVSILACLTGKELEYVIGHGPFNKESKVESANNKRYFDYFNRQLQDEAFQTGGASYLWFRESIKATEELVKKRNVKRIEVPILLIQSGRDNIVKPGGQKLFAKLAKNCELHYIEEAEHEPFMAEDEIFKPWLNKVLDFYKKNL